LLFKVLYNKAGAVYWYLGITPFSGQKAYYVTADTVTQGGGLLYHNFFGMVAPATLVFYGLACLNASKYTLNDIRNLGILEIILGLISLFNLGYGLEFWAFGFGVLHIVYGLIMYYKYEQ